jgi:glycolate oxidase
MKFKKITEKDILQFSKIVGEVNVKKDYNDISKYSKDETEDLIYKPEVVIKPNNTNEISELLKYCNDNLIPVTARGAGTGLAGGALAVYGGVVLTLENLDKIINIDTKNLQVTTESGVITEILQNSVKELGLYYPPDPASKGSCFIGGNINTNSGGPRAVKYGVVKDYVLNLEVVLSDGSIIWTAANTLKNSTGYNLTQLIIGSEGTLGIVTKAVLKLIPYPKYNLLLSANFENPEDACKAVSEIFKKGIIPSALEFMERSAIIKAIDYLGDKSYNLDLNTNAQLLIEVDGNYLENLYQDCEKINEVLEKFNCKEVLFADTDSQKEKLWKLRRCIGHAVKKSSVYKEEDTVVPRAELANLLMKVKDTGKKYGFESVCYGHAGDGNLHVNILKGNMTEEQWNNDLTKGIREIFSYVKSIRGTISGEHGIGLVQKNYLDIVLSETELSLMRSIKKVFDPNNILNPGKIF